MRKTLSFNNLNVAQFHIFVVVRHWDSVEKNPKHLPASDEYHPQRDQIEFQPPDVGSGDQS